MIDSEQEEWIKFRKECKFCKNTKGSRDLCIIDGNFHGDCVRENCSKWRPNDI